jgi:hypothetical protein
MPPPAGVVDNICESSAEHLRYEGGDSMADEMLERMSVQDLLGAAERAGIALRADGDRLIVRGPRTAQDIGGVLLNRKAEVLKLLSSPQQQLERVLQQHDWYYHFSDDAEVRRRGEESETRVLAPKGKSDCSCNAWCKTLLPGYGRALPVNQLSAATPVASQSLQKTADLPFGASFGSDLRTGRRNRLVAEVSPGCKYSCQPGCLATG